MEESSHTWLKYTCRRFACSLVFLTDFSMSSQNVQYGKNVTLFLNNVKISTFNLLRCMTQYRAKRQKQSIKKCDKTIVETLISKYD